MTVTALDGGNTISAQSAARTVQRKELSASKLLEADSVEESNALPLPGTSLLIDNWLMQDVGRLLLGEFAAPSPCVIHILPERDEHQFHIAPFAAIQVQALLTLLGDIVFRENLIVDVGFRRAREASPEMVQLAPNAPSPSQRIVDPF
ncbi:MAG TPA: hypothetical protein PKI03_36075 [Pseudomonadota bacterium]|nr:hypothetical protein [Pseudomonadota bacterium]